MNPGRMRQLTVFVGPFFNIYYVNLKRPNRRFKIQMLNKQPKRLHIYFACKIRLKMIFGREEHTEIGKIGM